MKRKEWIRFLLRAAAFVLLGLAAGRLLRGGATCENHAIASIGRTTRPVCGPCPLRALCAPPTPEPFPRSANETPTP